MFLPRPSMTGLFSTAPGQGQGAKSRRALLLLGAILLYLTLGAVVFSAFEYDQDRRAKDDIAKRRKLMQQKYNFTTRYQEIYLGINCLITFFSKMTLFMDFALLERVVVKSIPFAAGAQWKFLGALYFCTVVITTIGYGHSTPITVGGKLFCMLYAMGGVPLGLITFQSVGERINHFIGLALHKIGRWLKRNRDIHWLAHVKSRHLLCVSCAIGCVTISVATGVFHQRERWSVFNSAYYCMITLSTIGFGDFVPAQTNQRLHTEPAYVLFTLFFILFGLAIFSACINLLILECMAYNADMVTARTRLKRMLSARITSSFRIVTGGGGGGGGSGGLSVHRPRGLMRRACAIRKSENGVAASGTPAAGGGRKHGVVVEKIVAEQKCCSGSGRRRRRYRSRQRRRTASLSLLRDIYRNYCLTHPTHFTVRRLPTPYIEHLVNTGTDGTMDNYGTNEYWATKRN